MKKGRVILTKERFQLTVDRLCRQLIEQYDDFSNTCIIGIQTGGVSLSSRLHKRLLQMIDLKGVEFGKLDITFYRDDFRTATNPLKAYPTEMEFLVEDKNVILVDDVLYTGRTVQAALTALNHYGRPRRVDLVSLVDRRFNRELPIQSNYTGLIVDALDKAYVNVEWEETEGEDRILIFENKR